jgi:hypothetical protein
MAGQRAAAFMLKECRIDSRRRDRWSSRFREAAPHERISIASRVEFSKADREVRREHEKKSLKTVTEGDMSRRIDDDLASDR